MLGNCEKNLVLVPGVFTPKIGCFLERGVLFPELRGPFPRIEGPFPKLRGCEMTRPLHFSNSRVVLDDQSGHPPAPQFWEGPLISGKVSVPLKNSRFEGVKFFFGPSKKNSTEGMDVTCAFCKKVDKNHSNMASAVTQTFHCRI